MIDGGWPALPRGNKIMLVLAVIGLAYLLLQTRPGPVRMSGWNGAMLENSASGALFRTGADGIVGEAAAEQSGRGEFAADDIPQGNPLGQPNTVMTQGYGVGTHAPAEVWGAVDLAIDGNGDRQADPEGTWGIPVYATHSGVVRTARDTWPAGNHIWVEGVRFKTGYAHLKDFAVEDGQRVERGQLIGYVGSTGQSSGPHLDYQVWKDGVNVNPLDYGALDGMGR